jgi:hypothetical protein
MTSIPVIRRKRPLRVYPESNPPRPVSNNKPLTARNVLTLPVRRRIPAIEQEPYINPYCRDPAKVLELKQFVEFGCGACHRHRLKLDRSGFHCAAGIALWPDGTNKTCSSFIRRTKQKDRSKEGR